MGDREQFWQTHVDACLVSGITQKAYCERHGIAPKTFRKWRARLAGTTRVIAADAEPHGGQVKGGAKEFFSPSFDDPPDRAQLVDLLTNPRFRRTWTPEQRACSPNGWTGAGSPGRQRNPRRTARPRSR